MCMNCSNNEYCEIKLCGDEEFCELFFSKENSIYAALAHNMKGYDAFFIFNY